MGISAGGAATCGVQNGAASTSITGSDDVHNGDWQWVSCVFTSGSSLALYVNGTLDTSHATTVISTSNTNAFWLGSDDADNYYVGYMDDFRYYNYAFSATELLMQYQFYLNTISGV